MMLSTNVTKIMTTTVSSGNSNNSKLNSLNNNSALIVTLPDSRILGLAM